MFFIDKIRGKRKEEERKRQEEEKRKKMELRKQSNEITSDEFVKISIRGRVAYGICCLENAMLRYGISGEGWNMLLCRMWEFTTLSAAYDETLKMLGLEKWSNLLYFLPEREYFPQRDYAKFIQRITFRDHMFLYPEEPPTKEVFEKLCDSYQAHDHETIKKICHSIFDIGSDELCAGIDDKSQNTLDELQKLLDMMYAEKIPMPEVEPFRQYDFMRAEWGYDSDEHGWGEPFDGTKYSKFIGEGK
ncbi:MAG: hypothetical protein J6D37_08410 [Clostridia bacterium]|nr:hypothetical protein [Clostridia bacterium]